MASTRLFAEEALALGHTIPGKDMLPLLSGDFRPDVIEALRRIKTKFKTGCITNNMPHNAAGGTDGRPLALCARDHGAVRRT